MPTKPTTGRRNSAYYESGFGDLSNGYCWQLTEHKGKFYLGTWDWSDLLIPILKANLPQRNGDEPVKAEQISDMSGIITGMGEYNLTPLIKMLGRSLAGFFTRMGFDLYVSDDGMRWKPITLNGLGNPLNYGIRNLLSGSDGKLYLVQPIHFRDVRFGQRIQLKKTQ